jgi:hypothetical protein
MRRNLESRSFRLTSKCFRTETAFLTRCQRSSGMDGARPSSIAQYNDNKHSCGDTMTYHEISRRAGFCYQWRIGPGVYHGSLWAAHRFEKESSLSVQACKCAQRHLQGKFWAKKEGFAYTARRRTLESLRIRKCNPGLLMTYKCPFLGHAYDPWWICSAVESVHQSNNISYELTISTLVEK